MNQPLHRYTSILQDMQKYLGYMHDYFINLR